MKRLLLIAAALGLALPIQAQYVPTTRLITKTTVSANSSTVICPGAAALKTEIQVQTGAVGIGIRGQTLTSATYGTTSSDPDIVITSAGQQYVDMWGINAPITAYTGTTQIVICIQTMRSAG